MTATAIPLVPTFVLPDPRPARGKHRTRRTLSDVLAWSRRARPAFALVGMTGGAVLAAVLS